MHLGSYWKTQESKAWAQNATSNSLQKSRWFICQPQTELEDKCSPWPRIRYSCFNIHTVALIVILDSYRNHCNNVEFVKRSLASVNASTQKARAGNCSEASLHHISIKQQQQTRQKIPECSQEITKGGGNFKNSLFLCVYMF